MTETGENERITHPVSSENCDFSEGAAQATERIIQMFSPYTSNRIMNEIAETLLRMVNEGLINE